MTGVVRSMYAYTEVASDDKHRYVDTKAYTRPKREIAQESRRTQCAAGTHRVRLEQPHVAGIQENSSMHRAENRETVFNIGLELESAGTVKIILLLPRRSFIATRPYATDCERPH